MIEDGFIIAAGDIALALPPPPEVPTRAGAVEEIWVAPSAGVPGQSKREVAALPGEGLEGDRHDYGTGTFPWGSRGAR